MEFIILAIALSCIFHKFKEIIIGILVICLIAILWEYKIIQCLFLIACLGIGIFYIKRYLSQKEKYKNETLEERKKREDLLKIKEWSKRNKC